MALSTSDNLIGAVGGGSGLSEEQIKQLDDVELAMQTLSSGTVFVDPQSTAANETGSSSEPYKTLQKALDESPTYSRITLQRGVIPPASYLNNDKSFFISWMPGAEVGYSSWSNTNQTGLEFKGTDSNSKFQFLVMDKPKFRNCAHGVDAKHLALCYFDLLDAANCGWSGQGLKLDSLEVRDGDGRIITLGTDSSISDLQAFAASDEVIPDSWGGRFEDIGEMIGKETRAVRCWGPVDFIDCGVKGVNGAGSYVKGQLQAVTGRTQHCLTGGVKFSQGQLYNGNHNVNVTTWESSFNGGDGFTTHGGFDFNSANIILKNNWNAALVSAGSANSSIKVAHEIDNNVVRYLDNGEYVAHNALGQTGQYTDPVIFSEKDGLIGTVIQRNSEYAHIMLISELTSQNSIGVNRTGKSAIYFDPSIGDLEASKHNIIAVDNHTCNNYETGENLGGLTDSDSVTIAVNNSEFYNTDKHIKPAQAGTYHVKPNSNSVVSPKQLNIVTDELLKAVTMFDGVNGAYLNRFDRNELQSILSSDNTTIQIIIKDTQACVYKGLTIGNVFVNGQQAGTNLNTMNDSVNAALSLSAEQYFEYWETFMPDDDEDDAEPVLAGTDEALVAGTNYNSAYVDESVADGFGNTALISNETGLSKADIWSTVPLNQIGENTIFETYGSNDGAGKRIWIGFVRTQDLNLLGDGVGGNNEIQWCLGLYEGYNAPWTIDGANKNPMQYNSTYLGNPANFVPASGVYDNGGKIKWKMSIEADGRMWLYFWSASANGGLGEWVYAAKTGYTLTNNDYHVVVRAYTQGAGVYGPFNNFRYPEPENTATFFQIESPDGEFYYPLFQTAEEAELVSNNLGGDGSYHTHTFPDDPTNTTWYMPSNVGGVMGGSSAPTGTTFEHNGVVITDVTWNVQATEPDEQHAYNFSDLSFEVNEGEQVNLQYAPIDISAGFTLSNVPSWLTNQPYSLSGTAPEITDGQDDVYTINVEAQNAYNSAPSTGTITITVKNDAANDVVELDTVWNKVTTFNGGSSHTKQVSIGVPYLPIAAMGASGSTVSANTDILKTSDAANSAPVFFAHVFKPSIVNSNIHVLNQGEGAGDNDDNIYIRYGSNGAMYFGWGRVGATNECYMGSVTAGKIYAVYVAFKGQRFSGSNATAQNLADAFDIRLASNESNVSLSSNLSTVANWQAGSTGARMDRIVTGEFTTGGRGANRTFKGEIALTVVGTLRKNQALFDDATIKTVIADPVKFMANADGETWRRTYRVSPSISEEFTFSNSKNHTLSGHALQVWRYGAGTFDSYSNGLRNQVLPSDQNATKKQFNSMPNTCIINASADYTQFAQALISS